MTDFNPLGAFADLDQVLAGGGLAACLIVAFVLLFAERNPDRNRRIFWGAVAGAMAFGFFYALPDWRHGIGLAWVIGTLMSWAAYQSTPYIKLRGRIYPASRRPAPPPNPASADPDYDPLPDSYLGASEAAATWWRMLAAGAACMLAVIEYVVLGVSGIVTSCFVAAFVIMPVSLGYWDASWGYPVARGQRIQLALFSVMTAGVFPAIYFTAYYAGKRWPSHPKRSMEYLIHPRFHEAAEPPDAPALPESET